MRGYTVEMSYLMPVILLVIMSSIFGIFYFHDKNIISGAAYETAAAGSIKAREETDEGELENLFMERVKNKCIFFGEISVSASVEEDEVVIHAAGRRKGMTVSVLKRMPVTEPEKKIRDIRRLKGLANGTKSND